MKILSPAFLLAEQPHDPSGESLKMKYKFAKPFHLRSGNTLLLRIISLLWRGRLSWAIRGNGEQREEEKKLVHCHHPTQHPHWARLSLSEKNWWTTPASRRKVVLPKLDQVPPTICWDDNKAGHRKIAGQSDRSYCTRSVPAGGWKCTLVHCLTCRPVSCSKLFNSDNSFLGISGGRSYEWCFVVRILLLCQNVLVNQSINDANSGNIYSFDRSFTPGLTS